MVLRSYLLKPAGAGSRAPRELHATTRALCSLMLISGLGAALACGDVDKPNVGLAIEAAGGTGGSSDGSGGMGTGGVSGGTVGVSTSGAGGQAPTTCKDQSRQCAANIPQLCAGSAWVDEPECSAGTPVCTGAGICAAFRLVNAGIDAFGVRPAETSMFVLKEQSLSMTPRACDTKFCVTGGIR